jgi:transposase
VAQANAATQRQLDAMRLEFQAMKHQLEWFRRQLFGAKSEKRIIDEPAQMHLGEMPIPASAPPLPGKEIAAHTRHARGTDYTRTEDEAVLFFDEKRVPVETIAVANPEIDGLTPDQFEVIGEKVSHRLAQRPGSYVILKYVRAVIKRRDTQVISCPAAPVGVIEGSRADVSFVAALITDKFCYHQPLYRQHQRLGDNGIKVSRPWLTQLTHAALALVEPVFTAQLDSIRTSRVKAMDETPSKAGRAGPGKMKGGYFWPVYGELDEICFVYHEGRGGKYMEKTLGTDPPPEGAVLRMGRNWLFCWTEVGAKYVGIAQSLIASCRLHDIDPYTYLVDVLQRVGEHPAADVAQLTPRLWKQHFAANPLRSDLYATSK